MSTAAFRALKERQKNRNLPTIEIPQVEEDELARVLRGIQEHIRMYEGDSGAPKERFVTIAELENAGLVKADVKGRFAYIAQVLEKDVAQKAGSTANPTQTEPVKVDTSRTSMTPSGGGTSASGSTASTAKLNDASDVNVANPANNDFLRFDGNMFTNFSLFKKDNVWFGQQRFEKPVIIRQQEAAPEAISELGYLYSRDISNITELFYKDDTGQEIQITTNGTLTVGGGGLSNIVEDLSPQLGASLDANGFDISFDDGTGIKFGDSDDVIIEWLGAGGLDFFGAASDQTIRFRDGQHIRIQDSTDADYIDIHHDGTDVNFTHANTTDWNITGITAIQAGTVDADFDAITATSYGGIVEADLVSKSAAETIAAEWDFTTNPKIDAAGIDTGTFADARIAESNVTQHEAAIDHDALTNFVAAEHVDWAGGAAGTIHTDNYIENVSTALSLGTITATTMGITSDGGADDVVLIEADTNDAGLLGSAKWDEIVANTVKVTNATHTGQVTGATALTLVVAAITGQTALAAGLASTDELLVSDGGVIKRMDVSVIEAYMQANIDHDALTNFLSAEHVDWAGAAAGTIHTDNYIENVSTALSLGTITATTMGITSDGGADDVVLIEADTNDAGLLGSAKWDEIVANTLKVTNATHTGQVTGATALTLVVAAITGQTELAAGLASTDELLVSDGGVIKRMDVSVIEAYMQANIDHDTLTNFAAGEHFTEASITITASQVSDFDTEVANETAVVANTAKVTNATHTGQVTGATALTLVVAAITGQTALAAGLASTDELLISDGGVIKRMDVSVIEAYMQANIDHDTLTNFAAGEHFTEASITITASQVSDFDTEVANETAVVANTAKVTNATHSGDVTGATVLTIAAKKVTLGMMADGTDGELITWSAAGVIAAVAVGTSGHVLTSGGVGVAPTFQAAASGSDTPWSENHDAAGFDLTDVGTLGIWDASAADKLELSHDGTDFNMIEALGTTANFNIRDGIRLKIFDSSDTDHIQIYHDGSDAFFTSTNAVSLFIDGGLSNVLLRAGVVLRIYDAGNTDYASLNHDGTDFNFAFTNTTDLNISGITTLQVAAAIIATGAVSGSNLSGTNTGDDGTVTSIGITPGNLIDVTGSPVTGSGNIAVAVDLSELIDMTAAAVTGDEMVLLDAGVQRRKAFSEINLSIFNDDLGHTENVSTALSLGTITATTMGITSDGGADDVVLIEADTNDAGLLGSAKWDEIVANTVKVTNATHSGDVTGSGALTIAAKKVTAAMMEDGTDGELFTWSAAGVLAKVAVGTVSHVLTSGGVGVAPTFQAATGGTPTDITVADESADTTCFPAFFTAVTGDLGPKTGTNLTFNSNTGDLSATLIGGIAVANLLDKAATETITGTWTVDTDNFWVDGGQYRMLSPDGLAEGRIYTIDGGGMQILTLIGDGEIVLLAEQSSRLKTKTPSATGDLSSVEIRDHGLVFRDVGFCDWRKIFEDTSVTLDARFSSGGVYFKDGTSAITLTLEASSSEDFPVDSVTQIINAGASGTISVTEGTGTTLYILDGSSKTDTGGTATIAAGGYATLYREAAGIYYIMGAGVS